MGRLFVSFYQERLGRSLRLLALDHDPALQLGDRRMLLDLHDIADRTFVLLVMRVVLLGAAHRLLHHRVRKAALNPHHDGLRLLVAHHLALQYALRHLSTPHFAVAARLPCAAVLMRAISRRTSRTRDVFASCPVARWKRRLNCSFLSLMSSSSSWSGVIALRSSGLSIGLWSTYSAMRSTKRVLIGSLAAARSSASRASVVETPSISNRMRPGLIRTTHNSGAPLPEPMRTSSGFFETGTSG